MKDVKRLYDPELHDMISAKQKIGESFYFANRIDLIQDSIKEGNYFVLDDVVISKFPYRANGYLWRYMFEVVEYEQD